MNSESSAFLNILPYIISAIISAIVSIIGFLYTRYYAISTNRRRIVRAIFRATEIADSSISLRELYELASLFALLELAIYFTIFASLISSFILLLIILPFLYIFPYAFLYMPYFNKVFAYIMYKLSKQRRIYKILEGSLNSYDPNFSKSYISYFFLIIYAINQYKLYENISFLTLFLLYEIPLITVFLIFIRVLPPHKFRYKTDIESSIFMSAGIDIKVKVHTSKDSMEGTITDIRDELVLSNEGRKIYIPWDNILYFEILDIKKILKRKNLIIQAHL